MPIYRIDNNKILPIERTTFAQQGLRERHDLQALLKSQIDVISPDTLIVAEEFSDWEDSRRRIDLLGIDKGANLVVIELKRTEDGGYMELQAIRYAAMISTLTFDELVTKYEGYLSKSNIEQDARESLLEFLDWNDLDEQAFGQEVKIVLASAEFSKELTTAVMWLNDLGLDIRCVRMHPYVSDGQTFMDVQTVIPIPEAADYQVRIRQKKQKERESRQGARDFSKYDVSIAGKRYRAKNKRKMMFLLVSEVLENGGTPEQIMGAIPKRKLKVFEGTLDAEQVKEQIMKDDGGGAVPRSKRFFCEEAEPFHVENKTYVLSNQWGNTTHDAAKKLAEMFPSLKIDYKQTV